MKQVVIGINVSKKTLQVALLFSESKPKQKCFDNQIEGRQKLLEWIAQQGDQFTATAFTQTLRQADVEISMDGRGRCYDNIFIERLWCLIKYELIYLKAFEDGKHLSRGGDCLVPFL